VKLEPYRVLFPIGLAYGLAGALLWLLHAGGRLAYPGPLHRALMIQGFELCFVVGFLLTALPGFLHAEKCHPVELALATLFALGFGALAWARQMAAAEACFVLTVLLLVVAALRRLARGSQPPPVEFLFVGLGLMLGLAGGIATLADAAGWRAEPVPGFGLRMASLGMVLSMVLGVGGLLVPTFTGVRQPLVIEHVAGPHQRAGRRVFYGALAALFLFAFALESRGQRVAGAVVRAVAATPLLLMVWKLGRAPARRDLFSATLRGAGWCVFTGLWIAALLPRYTLAGYHVVFVGGFGLLTMGIATRVVVAHGGHGMDHERRLLTPWSAGALVLALVTRVAGELLPDWYFPLLGASGVLWSVGWLLWAARALPLMMTPRPASIAGAPPVAAG
jgi:uncharacterized protein involved in response to NO